MHVSSAMPDPATCRHLESQVILFRITQMYDLEGVDDDLADRINHMQGSLQAIYEAKALRR